MQTVKEYIAKHQTKETAFMNSIDEIEKSKAKLFSLSCLLGEYDSLTDDERYGITLILDDVSSVLANSTRILIEDRKTLRLENG